MKKREILLSAISFTAGAAIATIVSTIIVRSQIRKRASRMLTILSEFIDNELASNSTEEDESPAATETND